MIIKINNSSTDADIKEFNKLLEITDGKLRFVKATIDYVVKNGIPHPSDNALDFPLKLYTDNGIVVCLLCCTACYGGTGPHTTVKVLRKAGFIFNEEEIYRNRDELHLTLEK